jgi:two-component system chemotaxis response regulator CheB
MIKVLLVDDSPLAIHVMQRLLARAADIRVAGTARNGREALPMLTSLQPDVICLDLNMPVMSGLEFTRQVMAASPRPILVFSVAVEPGMPGVFDLLQAGAVDVLPKPANLQANDDRLAAELITKVRLVAGVKVFRRGLVPQTGDAQGNRIQTRAPARLVVIGASTGGPEALRRILAELPARFALPLVCIQHIGREFLAEMVAWLGSTASLKVGQALNGELPLAGRVYFAPADVHLGFDQRGHFALSHAPAVDGHRPSVTVAMNGAATRIGSGTVGVLLTGMGRDGAAGMAAIARTGGVTIAQDEASCVVYGMPGAAVALGAVQHVLPLGQIAKALVALAAGSRTTAEATRK